jgi:hypothetical protein
MEFIARMRKNYHGSRIFKFRLSASVLLAMLLLPLLALPAYAAESAALSNYRTALAAEQAAQDKVNGDWGGVPAADQAALTAAQATAKSAYAALSGAEKDQLFSDQTRIVGFPDQIRTIIAILFSLGTSLAVINVVWQGFKMMGGNPQAAKQAKSSITKSIIGLIIILFSWTIVGFAVNLVSKI